MSFKTQNNKLHPGRLIIGENGLPVDTIATISGSYQFDTGQDPLTYANVSATVTMPVGTDLTDLATAKPRYTGKYILLTADGILYYISRNSIDIANRTFVISLSDKSQINPLSIDLSGGWKLAEADIVNRLATTSAAKIDSIEFRDLHFQMELDGDPVTVRGENGNTLEPNPDGSINANVTITEDGVNTPTISNTNLATAGTEYMVSLPINAKRFSLKARNNARLEIRYSPSPSNHMQLKPGAVYSESGLKTTVALDIYITSNKDNTILELLYWE